MKNSQVGLIANGHYRKKVSELWLEDVEIIQTENREKKLEKNVQVFIIYGMISIGSKKHTSWRPNNRRDRVNKKTKTKTKPEETLTKVFPNLIKKNKSRKQSKSKAW